MWTKRKPRNRRNERSHILDVKVHSRQLRSIRVRMVARVVSRLLGTAVLLFLLWRGGDWMLDQLLFKNPAFAVQNIEVETDGILPVAQLRVCAGVRLGDNLLALDLSRIQRDLEYLPWIKSAAVERVRPHTLRIRVEEREPIAQTTLFDPSPSDPSHTVFFYFDEEGYVMLPLSNYRLDTAALGFDRLPLLSGVSGVDLRPGHAVESRQIQTALALISAFHRSPMLGLQDLKQIDLSVPQVLLATTSDGAQITFGIEQLDLQLRRWRLVNDLAVRSGKAVAFLDLSVSNNVPARWTVADAAGPLLAKPPKPSPYRKKHV